MSIVARALSALAGGAARRPLSVLACMALLGAGAGALALSLHPSASTDTFVGRSSGGYRATQRYYRAFGEEPVDVLVQGNLEDLLLSADIDRLLGLEGCLAGRVPPAGLPHEGGNNGPCGQLDRLGTVKVVIGPATFVNEAVQQIDTLLTAQGNEAERTAAQNEHAIRHLALAQGRSSAEAATLAREAGTITRERYVQQLAALGAQYGIDSAPTLNNPSFVYTLVFDNTAHLPGTPKQRFAYLFPGRESALISVRMKAGLSESQRAHTLALIRRALAMPQWRLAHGEHYLLTGQPVIVSELTSSITHSVLLLLVAVLLAMALALELVFRGRPRLLPLAIAVLATALTFGTLAAVGASLTVAQVAVLPVLVGLAVDYAIQFQSRVHEARAGGAPDAPAAIRLAAATAGPTIAAAAAAGAAALLVMTLSPVPTVRGFALLLVAGIAIALLCALTAGSAVMALAGRSPQLAGAERPGIVGAASAEIVGTASAGIVGAASAEIVGTASAGIAGAASAEIVSTASAGIVGTASAGIAGTVPAGIPGDAAKFVGGRRLRDGGAATRLASSWRGAQELVRDNALTRLLSRAALDYAVRNPGRTIAVGLTLAVLGWGLDTQTHVETNLEKLVPQSMSSLRDLRTLERDSGVGGEIDLLVSGRNVATPKTIEWMNTYQNAVLKRFGYNASRGCGTAQLCPAFSLPTLFEQGATLGSGNPSPSSSSSSKASRHASGSGASAPANSSRAHSAPAKLTAAEVNGLLRTIPGYFSQNAIAPNHRTATLAFGIRLMSLTQQQHVIEAMRAALHPPRGLNVQLVGLPVLAAQSGAQVASPWRRVLTLLAGLAAAALVLLIAFRGDRRRALTPLLPVVLATGWSALVVFVIRVPLNPMSVTLSALVIAVSTEFSVLLSERFRRELASGLELPDALRRTYALTGAAVAASGVTAIVGFGVLILSPIAMLRDFGIVTLVDLTVSLVGVLIALPASLLLIERRHARSAPDPLAPQPPAPQPPTPQSPAPPRRARRRPRHEPA